MIVAPLLAEDMMQADENGRFSYIKDARKAVEKVDGGEFDVVFFLNPTTIDEIKAVVESGERMPQKSTYFYPKPLSGILMCRL